MSAPVVAGFDGSVHSQRAVDWAAEEARLRRRPLVIVHSFLVLNPQLPGFTSARADAVHTAVNELVDTEVDRVRKLAPDVEVSGRVTGGFSPSTDLVDASQEASLLVVGSRGRGAFTGLLLGSTSSQVLALARCPVVVVRDAPAVQGDLERVVVGVDGSPLSQAALRFGFEEASMRGCRLIAVHAWNHPVSAAPADLIPLVYDTDALAADEERLLAESLAGWQGRYPDVPVERVCARADARQLLKDHADGARLLVLGARSHSGFTGLIPGSIARAMVHHVQAPVAIIPPDHDR